MNSTFSAHQYRPSNARLWISLYSLGEPRTLSALPSAPWKVVCLLLQNYSEKPSVWHGCVQPFGPRRCQLVLLSKLKTASVRMGKTSIVMDEARHLSVDRGERI